MRDPIIDEIIRCYALFQTPSQVDKTMKQKFGDNAPNFYTIAKVRTQYRLEILEVRKELEANLPILHPDERWGYWQCILDDSLTERPIILKGKQIGVAKDLKIALESLKLANAMTEQKGTVQPENESAVRATVMEAYDALKDARPRASDQEIVASLIEGLGNKYKPFIEELVDYEREPDTTENEA